MKNDLLNKKYDELSPGEKDALWLLNKISSLTQDEIEKFCFKVAYLTEEENHGWSDARTMAYNEYFAECSRLN